MRDYLLMITLAACTSHDPQPLPDGDYAVTLTLEGTSCPRASVLAPEIGDGYFCLTGTLDRADSVVPPYPAPVGLDCPQSSQFEDTWTVAQQLVHDDGVGGGDYLVIGSTFNLDLTAYSEADLALGDGDASDSYNDPVTVTTQLEINEPTQPSGFNGTMNAILLDEELNLGCEDQYSIHANKQ